MLVPAGLYNAQLRTIAQAGAGVPMATDIAFALGILSLGIECHFL
jgi:NhaA family Na+:H+ antiporter